jgi:hypothetical protein
MSAAAAAVLLMAPADASSPEEDAELERLLGRERLAELRASLLSRAAVWAREITPDALHLVDGGDRLSDAIDRAFATHDGPLLVVWPSFPQLRSEHAAAALGDLQAGCDVVLGPVIDGGLYLLGLARPLPSLLALGEDRWQDPDVMTIGFSAARDAGLEVGILRAERALRRPGDIKAALADPLLPDEISRLLR